MFRIEKSINKTVGLFNWVAALALVGMMLLTCADVVMRRSFNKPIPGTYEIVALLGALLISFALAYTTSHKGHIAVEFLVQRFSKKVQRAIDAVNQFLGIMLFVIIAWQSLLYAMDMQASGEVSLTVQMPIHPFIFGIAMGCALVSLVLLLEFFKSLKRLSSR
ncbi:MAG: TRAP transporter small permease [Deltaproteobacteria bacterium]|nr:TRAP transporter small permease [Deltaproteobacteria bacterium]